MKKVATALVAALAAGLLLAAGVSVDFTRDCGRVKPLHGVNNAPMRVGENPQWEFAEAGIPYMRTHDTAGMWGGTHYVDIPNIFPDFDADENDPKSYDFTFTDAWLTNIVAAGAEGFYRLGVTIENYHRIKAYNIYPPKDFAKWARICEHVVAHYNEGWADGYRWGIDYWEIWNEPENPPMWKGTREQFFELYRVAANHLKARFPGIKVGGYGGCGFYAIDSAGGIESTPFRKSFVTWFEDFLKFVTDPKTKAPLDFYSWHLYVKETPERIARHAAYVRKKLDAAGLAKTESIFNEWNRVGKAWNEFGEMKSEVGAACVAEAFCIMQRSSVDKAMYYDALPTRTYCGVFNFGDKKESRTTTYHAFRYWNGLYRLGTAVESAADAPHLDVAAAKGAKGGKAVFLVNDTPEPRTVKLALKGADGAKFSLYQLDDDHDGFAGVPCDPSKPLALAPFMTALLTTEPMPLTANRAPVSKAFAGQDDSK